MQQRILSHLGPVARVGTQLTYLDTCPSTNDLMKAMAEAGAADGTVLVAGEQTRGKGRLGRSFTSAANKGVYLSALLRPDLPPEALLPLTGFTAEAMGGAVRRVTGTEPGIKWVNDLLLNGKKICGILTESAFGAGGRLQYVVVGVGLNVNYDMADFPEELRSLAGSLKTELGRAFDLAALAAAMIEALDELYAALLTGDAAPYLQEGMTVILSTHNDVPIAIDLPRTVILEIVDTEPSVKGQTASSSYKPAVLSNGVKTTVPPYITAGTKVVILTEDGSYVERAKD